MNAQEGIKAAWERNRESVKLRHPYLSEEDIELLEELCAVPLPNGEVLLGPLSVKRLYTRLNAIEEMVKKLEAKSRRKKPQEETR